VVEGAYKAPGGLVRVTATLHDHRVDDLALSGDFTLLPADGLGALEDAARGLPVDRNALAAAMAGVYRELDLRSPGLEPEDFARAIVLAAGG
jgi:lipoate-protein ligase A